MKVSNLSQVLSSITMLLVLIFAIGITHAAEVFSPADEQGRFVYLVRFVDPGLLETFGTEGMRGAEAERAQLRTRRAKQVNAIETVLSRAVSVTHHYQITHSGIATRLSIDEAAQVARLPGVVSVERERLETIDTYRGPTFIGSDGIWDGSAVPGAVATEGGGIVIGVLDTGIDPDHPSFQNNAACGHGDALPDKLLSYVDCGSTDTDGRCNGSSPTDTNGHGTHTASTAGGNWLDTSASPPPAPPAPFTGISGVAPCASIRSYKVCPSNSCPGASIIAGIENVIEDAVDVINFSISGGTLPWDDADRLFLDAVGAGIFVAASAGNTNQNIPNPVGQVNHRGPWVMTVAASTHDAPGSGLLSASAPGSPPPALRNISATGGSASPNAPALTALPIRHFAEQSTNYEGCTPGEDGVPPSLVPFPEDFFEGAAALIHRGICPFSTKIANAYAAGAELVIIRNNQAAPINMITEGQPDVPAYSINQTPGNALLDFVTNNPDSATIDFDPISGDVLADFSLRGPTPPLLADLTKPDITAPGVGIYAAVPVGLGGYADISGTSMSGPHVAGAAALVRAIHPDWTPAEIKSALQMTASRPGRKESLLDSWDWDDVGSGRADLSKAALAGLVMGETFDNYLAADPAEGGDVKTLNLPSVRNVSCDPDCTFIRRVRSALEASVMWQATVDQPPGFEVSVTPGSFVIESGEEQELTITATPLPGEPGTTMRFGAVNLHAEQSPDLHWTVALRGTGSADRPIIAVDPDSFQLSIESGLSEEALLTIANPGVEPLTWTIGVYDEPVCDPIGSAWVGASPVSGNTQPEGSSDAVLEVDTTGLSLGEHEATLCIESNDLQNPQVLVPVSLTVTELVMESDLSIILSTPQEMVWEGEPVDYVVEVHNGGPRDVIGARVISTLGAELADIHWTCTAGPGAACPASGGGDLNVLVDIEAGDSITFEVTAVLADAGDGSEITSLVMVNAPEGLIDPNSGNNLSQVTLQRARSNIFSDRFEP